MQLGYGGLWHDLQVLAQIQEVFTVPGITMAAVTAGLVFYQPRPRSAAYAEQSLGLLFFLQLVWALLPFSECLAAAQQHSYVPWRLWKSVCHALHICLSPCSGISSASLLSRVCELALHYVLLWLHGYTPGACLYSPL